MEERIEFLNSKKEKLVGIYHKNISKELVILCHGYKISKDFPAIKGMAELLYKKGYSIFRFDFSGHGESEGNKRINIIQQVSDINTAISYFSKKFEEIILVGGSFAGFITAIASAKNKKVSRLITINGLFNIKNCGYWYFLLKVLTFFNPMYKRQLNYYNKYYLPEKIKIPTLVIHAKEDKIISPKQSTDFYSLLNTNKKLEILQKGDHYLSKQEYLVEIVSNILRWLKT